MEAYKVVEQLGRGSYGDAFICEKIHNKEKVVMKKIPCDADSAKIERLVKNEANILKSLKHPNIIEYFDSYFREKEFHIIMEYARHGTLYEFIKKEKPQFLPKEWVMTTFTQILLGLDLIHKKSIVHRDLKTENIFLCGPNANMVKIGDFGIAKALQCKNKTNTTIGTINYLSPEVCDGKSYGLRSDIWALGCVLYELCAMERHFDGPMSEMIANIKSGTRKQVNIAQYGAGVQDIINSCIQVDRKSRPTTKNLLANVEVFPVHAKLMVNLGNFCLPPAL